jgi:spore photoproduct lyase
MERFDEICIERSVLDTELARRIMARTQKDRLRIVSGKQEAVREGVAARSVGPGFKRRLFIAREEGRFLRRCPGTTGMKCCNLFVLNPVVGCPYDCTYCFLQAYQNEPFITVYANLEDLEAEVSALKALNKGRLLRICTGELADSLALEPIKASCSSSRPSPPGSRTCSLSTTGGTR